MITERKMKCDGSGDFELASMRPRSDDHGKRNDLPPAAFHVLASMRPRSDDHGKCDMSHELPASTIVSFNEAAIR